MPPKSSATKSSPLDNLDGRLNLEKIPLPTIYLAEHALERGMQCIGFVFRGKSGVEIIFDQERRRLTEQAACRIIRPRP